MSENFGHHQISNRYVLTGDLELLTALRLSSGRATEVTDNPLMRDRAGRLYIPGTSLRGALRSEVERIVGAAGKTQNLSSCTLFCSQKPNDEGRKRKDPRDWNLCITAEEGRQERFRDLSEAEIQAQIEDQLCDVCHLFGSPVFASRLSIADLYPVGERAEEGTQVRDGVAIDRDTGTARDNLKFDFEVLEPLSPSDPAAGRSKKGENHRFGLRLEVENLTTEDKKLLDLVRGLLLQGFHLGGKRAAGLGRVRLAGDFKVQGYPSPEGLWDALVAGTSPLKDLCWKEVRPC